MDDTIILLSKESTTCKILSLVDDQIIWCRMKVKPKKLRSLSLRKGKLNQNINFKVSAQRILIVLELVKSLGHWFDESLKVKDTSRILQGLYKIDQYTLHPCNGQIWCLQQRFIPMLWLLLVYEIATSTVESMEAKINKYTWKWLGLPPGFSDVALYCR